MRVIDVAAIARDVRLGRWLAERETVRTTRFATRSELLCSAFLHTTTRARCEDDLEAFVRLWLRDQLIVEELDAMEAPFFLASFEGVACEPLTETEWNEETSLHVGAISKAIGERKLEDDERSSWGIFVDDVRVDEATYRFEIPGRFEEAVALRKKWNDVALFAKTSDAYALFMWGTSA